MKIKSESISRAQNTLLSNRPATGATRLDDSLGEKLASLSLATLASVGFRCLSSSRVILRGATSSTRDFESRTLSPFARTRLSLAPANCPLVFSEAAISEMTCSLSLLPTLTKSVMLVTTLLSTLVAYRGKPSKLRSRTSQILEYADRTTVEKSIDGLPETSAALVKLIANALISWSRVFTGTIHV